MRNFLLLAVLLAGCASTSEKDWGFRSELSNAVSAVELVAHGQKYHEWPVRVYGIAHFGQEDTLLFATDFSYRAFDTSATVLIDILDDLESLGVTRRDLMSLSGRVILLEGTYEHIPRIRLGPYEYTIGPDYVGAITSINRLALVY